MRYKTESVKDCGAKFILAEGSARELYDSITGSLEQFYKKQNSAIAVPYAPDFTRLPNGDSRLPPITFRKEEGKEVLNHGKIAVSYFGRARKEKRTRADKEIDFATSYNPSAKKAYESLTIFFNTIPKNVDKKDLAWANETQRDNFLKTLEDRL